MFDLSMYPTPLQIECERLRKEVEIGKATVGRMMVEYGDLRDEKNKKIARLREALDTIARVSNDPAIVTCAKRALMPNAKVSGAGTASAGLPG